jgi:hypothetical protein
MLVDKNNTKWKGGLLMRTIIQQILSKATDKFINYYEENGMKPIALITEDIKNISDGMAKEIVTTFIESADQSICEAKAERKTDGITIHEKKVPRTVYTALGSLTYHRTYFKVPSGRSYLVDKILGVGAYERIDSGVSAKLVNHAAIHSYGRSADIVTDGQISRQSVRNKVMNTGEVAYVPKKAEETPEILHIFADEDHVNLQEGGNAIVPIVTVCGGKRYVCKGRNELTEPFHVQGYGMKTRTFWEYVYALCAEKYDMDRVKRVYIYGDGARWITGYTEVFSDALYVLDEFHFRKRMKGLFAGELCSPFRLVAHKAIQSDDKILFDRIVQGMLIEVEERMPEGKERTGRIKRIKENAAYILKHWDGVQNRMRSDTIGSATEAMVSHVLSARLSRNPMGWSREGLSKMSMIRVYVINGGKIKPKDTVAWKRNPDKCTVTTELEKYETIVKSQQDEILKNAKGWRWFEVEDWISGKTTGTKVALDALGRTRNVS